MATPSSVLRAIGRALSSFVLLLVSIHVAHAEWPNDPHVNVPLCVMASHQHSSVSVSDGEGGAIVAWVDFRNGSYDIYAQHVLSGGEVDRAWPVNGRALCTAPGYQTSPSIISDGEGGAIVVWEDDRVGQEVTTVIHAQHVLADGVVDPAWPVNGRALTAGYGQFAPRAASDGAGGAIVCWADSRPGGNPFYGDEIYAQRILASGEVDPSWPPAGRAVCTAVGTRTGHVIAIDGAGGAFVVWSDERGSESDIYAQRLLSTGDLAPSWPIDGRLVCGAPGAQPSARIVSDGMGGGILSWVDARPGADEADIYAHRLLPDGLDPTWQADGVPLCTAPGAQYSPTMAQDGAGGAIVVWIDGRPSSTGPDLYAHHVSVEGQVDPVWPAAGLPLCNAPNTLHSARAVSDGDGGAIVAWIDERDGGPHVYAQLVLSTGFVGASWPTDGRAICTAGGARKHPTMVTDMVGGAIIAWADARNPTGDDIYAQRVLADGLLGGETTGVEDGSPVQSALAFSFSNPVVNGALTAWFSLDFPASVQLELFDVAGRCVARRDFGQLGAGAQMLGFGRELRIPSGTYVMRLRHGVSSEVARVTFLD